ncbi:MAG: hypothetical protein ACK42K_04490 [Leptonema sp. (in: bacteria)]
MKKLLFFLFVSSIYPQKIEFFPEILQTNPRNNHGMIFTTEKFFTQKRYFVVHQGKEGFYLKLKNPLRFKNQIFSVSGNCTIIEGSFAFFLVLKNQQNKTINVPTEYKFLTENNLNPYEILFNDNRILKYLQQSNKTNTIQDILNIELLGFLIVPHAFRTVFYCEEFSIKAKSFLIDVL